MSSDSARTVPFQVAVVMRTMVPRVAARCRQSPAQGVDGARLRRPARPAVSPRDDAQRRRRLAALRALHRLGRMGPGGADLLAPLLVDRCVALAWATQMTLSAASTDDGNGVPPGRLGGSPRRYRPARVAGTAARVNVSIPG